MVPAPALTFTETAKIRNRKLLANGRAASTHWYSFYDKMKRPSTWQSGGIHGTSDGGVPVRRTGCDVGSRAGSSGSRRQVGGESDLLPSTPEQTLPPAPPFLLPAMPRATGETRPARA